MIKIFRQRADFMPTLNSVFIHDTPQSVVDRIKSLRDRHLGGDKYLGKGVWEVTEEEWNFLEDLFKNIPHMVIDQRTPRPCQRVLKIDKNSDGGLYSYQDIAAEEMRNRKNVLLFFDTGTGKTRTSLSALSRLSKEQDALIVVGEGNLSLGWKRQVELYFQELLKRISILNDGRSIPDRIKAIQSAEKGTIFILNIEAVRNKALVTALNARNLAVTILDECQYIIGTSAQQTAGMHDIKSEYRWALSATPIKNSPLEWHSLLAWLRVVRLEGMLTRFREHYSYAFRNKFGQWEYTSFRNEQDLEDLKNLVSLRVEKSGLELPEKREVSMELEPDEELKKLMSKIEREKKKEEIDFKVSIGNQEFYADNPSSLFFIERAATAVSYEKVRFIIRSTKEPIIVVSRFKFPLEYLKGVLGDSAVLYNGDIEKEERQRNMEAFISGEKKVFLMTRKSGGTGLDGLQKVCSKMVFLDAPDNRADFVQCADRVHRAGQEKEVEIVLLKIKNSIDTYAWENLDKKFSWVDRYYKVNYEGEKE